jgi:hypothetical protein
MQTKRYQNAIFLDPRLRGDDKGRMNTINPKITKIYQNHYLLTPPEVGTTLAS